MAKGWVYFASINELVPDTKEEQRKKLRKSDNAIRNIKTMEIKDLLKESEDAYQRKCAEDAFLMAGFKDKKLKSKELIRRVNNKKKTKPNNQ